MFLNFWGSPSSILDRYSWTKFFIIVSKCIIFWWAFLTRATQSAINSRKGAAPALANRGAVRIRFPFGPDLNREFWRWYSNNLHVRGSQQGRKVKETVHRRQHSGQRPGIRWPQRAVLGETGHH